MKVVFPHFHLHCEYSVRDGIGSPEDYAKQAADLGVPMLAITDHGQFAAAPRQFWACKKLGLKAVYGIEIYQNEHRLHRIREVVASLRRKVRGKSSTKQDSAKLLKAEAWLQACFQPSAHGCIHALNSKGFVNVSRISSDAWLRGFYYRPRTDLESLAKWSDGVHYSTACMGGWVPRVVLEDYDEAKRRLLSLREIYGDNLSVELVITSFREQAPVNVAMLKLAKSCAIRTILTADCHYPFPEDSRAQDVLLLMRDRKTISDATAGDGVWQFEAKDLFFKNTQQVLDTARSHHSEIPRVDLLIALQNTVRLQDRFESFDLDAGIKMPGIFPDARDGLRRHCIKGLGLAFEQDRLPKADRAVYVDRLKYELRIIEGKNFSEYFLILEDLCAFARNQGFAMGPSRGSAGGSLVSFLLGITTGMDPVQFRLPFERFLDPSRSDPPDIDLDFEPGAREPIKDYLRDRYPAVAAIGSWSVFKPRSLLQDVGRVFEIPSSDTFHVTNEIGDEADKMEWNDVFETFPKMRRWAEQYPEAFQIVKRLRGMVSHRGVAASGVLVGPAGCLDTVPLVQREGVPATAWADSQEHRELSNLGYLKIDVLGVSNVSVVPRVLQLTHDHWPTNSKPGECPPPLLELCGEHWATPEDIPLDDPMTLAQFHDDPTGAFQFDTRTTVPIIELVGVDSFWDLPVITSLCRPGPLMKGVPQAYAKRKKDPEWSAKCAPYLRDLLRETYGLMVYQEDVMAIAREIGGLSPAEANAFRKIIGKKQDKVNFNKYRLQFFKGALERGLTKEEIKDLWLKILEFASYAFNRAHACAYSLTAYRQMWCRAHLPVFYFTALLEQTERAKKQAGRDVVNLHRYMRAAMRASVEVMGPNVNVSQVDFSTDGTRIYFGLSKIKGVKGAAEEIIAKQPFADFKDFCQRVERRRVNARVLKALAYAGAFDSMVEWRDDLSHRNRILDAFKELRRSKEIVPEHGTVALLRLERESLGLCLSPWTTMSAVRSLREKHVVQTISEALRVGAERFDVLGEVVKFRPHKTRQGKRMAFFSIADETAELDNVTAWPEELENKHIGLGSIGVFRLKRRANTRKDYGQWSYYFRDNLERPYLPLVRLFDGV